MSAAGLLLHGSLDAEGAEIADSLDLSGAIITGDVKIGDAKLGTSLVFGNEPERFDPRLARMFSVIALPLMLTAATGLLKRK